MFRPCGFPEKWLIMPNSIIFVVMKPAPVREIINRIATSLGELYSDQAEGKAVAELLMMNQLKTTRAGLYGIGGEINDPVALQNIQNCFLRLQQNEPIQYVLEKAWFCGLELKALKGVLIPRPETEELVDWVVEKHFDEQENIDFLDIGTGSGCIALGLKSRMPEAQVSGMDVSEEAIDLARENADHCGFDIHWLKQDLFADDFKFQSSRKLVVVSNPPYVLESESKGMASRVTSFEPHLALFVADSDPLLYYRRILELFSHTASFIYFEINPLVADSFFELAEKEQFRCITREDFCGRKRFVEFRSLTLT